MSGALKDNVLEFFVQASNKHGFTLDLTLNVSGAVISGTLISAKEYFDEMAESFEDGNEIAQELSKQLSISDESIESSSEANFIHMKNTKVYCGDSKPTPAKGEILWRGKINEIDGFFLGKIAESKSSSSTKKKSSN